jgi:predicted RNA binding protein YcfA (HicA-like mRNA interferase family)
MRLPRDVAADRLLRVLEGLGYQIVRQRGSHVRLTHPGAPEHSISVPRHGHLKTGTLHAILTEVSAMRSISIETLTERL